MFMANIKDTKKQYKMFTIRVPEDLVVDVERLAQEKMWTRNKTITYLLLVGHEIASKGKRV